MCFSLLGQFPWDSAYTTPIQSYLTAKGKLQRLRRVVNAFVRSRHAVVLTPHRTINHGWQLEQKIMDTKTLSALKSTIKPVFTTLTLYPQMAKAADGALTVVVDDGKVSAVPIRNSRNRASTRTS